MSAEESGATAQDAVPPVRGVNGRRVVAVAMMVVVAVALIGWSQDWFGSGEGSSRSLMSDDVNVAVALIEAGQTDEASLILESILESNPLDVLANYNMGVIAQFAGDNNSAVRYYAVALQGQPDFESALYNLGLAYRDIGQIDQAISTLQSVVSANPENAAGLYNLGTLLIEQGNEEAGNSLIEQARRINPAIGE